MKRAININLFSSLYLLFFILFLFYSYFLIHKQRDSVFTLFWNADPRDKVKKNRMFFLKRFKNLVHSLRGEYE